MKPSSLKSHGFSKIGRCPLFTIYKNREVSPIYNLQTFDPPSPKNLDKNAQAAMEKIHAFAHFR
jgi:hypothetical protein